MALEDRGADKETSHKASRRSQWSIYLSNDPLEQLSHLLTKQNLGGKFHLAFIFEQVSKLGLNFKDKDEKKKKAIGGAFFERLRFSMNHSLCEVKFKPEFQSQRATR
jgi:hypothetical protein